MPEHCAAICLGWKMRRIDFELLQQSFWSRPPQRGLSAKAGAAHTSLSTALGTDSAGCTSANEGMMQSSNFVFFGKYKPGLIAILWSFLTFQDNCKKQATYTLYITYVTTLCTTYGTYYWRTEDIISPWTNVVVIIEAKIILYKSYVLKWTKQIVNWIW